MLHCGYKNANNYKQSDGNITFYNAKKEDFNLFLKSSSIIIHDVSNIHLQEPQDVLDPMGLHVFQNNQSLAHQL